MYIGTMYIGAGRRRVSHLWQLPLLIVSMALFGCAAYLFVDARPGITLNQKLAGPRQMLKTDRPNAAAEQLERLLGAERLPDEQAAQVHLLLAESVEASAKQNKQPVAADHLRVIEQTQMALAKGAKPSGDIHRRLGESYESLKKPVEAVWQYRQAIAMDPPRAIRLRRRVIDLQLATSDWVPAEASIEAYLGVRELTDSERAWAKSLKAQLLIDRGEYVDARATLEDVLRLVGGADPVAQAEARYRLGLCAWKLGSTDEAKKMLTTAQAAFRGQHPLEADAAYALGAIAREQGDPAGAIAQFDAAIAVGDANGPVRLLARLARGACWIQKGGDVSAGVADLLAVAEKARAGVSSSAAAASAATSLRDAAATELGKAADTLAARENHAAAIELLLAEQALADKPVGALYVRLGDAYDKHAGQVAQSIGDATPAERLRREQLSRELNVKSGDALLAASRALATEDDKAYADTLWRAMDQYERGGGAASAVAAMELFVTDRAANPIAADVLLRLGQTYDRAGQTEKAASAYGRLHGGYPQSPAAVQAAVPLAMLLAASPEKLAAAEAVLRKVVDDPRVARDAGEAYKHSLFELGSIEQRTGKLKEATAHLEQFVAKFTRDERLGEATFLLGECHRASAQEINVQLAAATAKAGAGEMAASAAAKKAQLAKAAAAFDRVEQLYVAQYGARPPTREADLRYQKLAALRRADCAYDLGTYAEAVKLYDAVAARWPNDTVALAACVQIVNSHFAQGRGDDAKAAHERARTLLAKMPQRGPDDGDLVMPRAYWEQWLKWTGMAAASAW